MTVYPRSNISVCENIFKGFKCSSLGHWGEMLENNFDIKSEILFLNDLLGIVPVRKVCFGQISGRDVGRQLDTLYIIK